MRGFTDAEACHNVIHHHGSGANLPRERLSSCAVASPDTRRQTKVRIVCEASRLLLAIKSHDGQDRTEGLFAHDAHFVIHIHEDGGGIEIWSEITQPLAPGQ